VLSLAAGAVITAAPAMASSATPSDSFFTYSGSEPLSSFPPGAVLDTRTVPYSIAGIATPLQAVQILYRSVNSLGQPDANVTTVLRSINGNSGEAISYQSAYDSLNPNDAPSRAIAGDVSLGGLIANAESAILVPLALAGYNVVLPDTEGPTADFAAGPEYGINTLNSIRAVVNASSVTGLNSSTKWGLIGYSGGSIATGWAAALAPGYAPDVNQNLVGFTEGGVLVDPIHNLRYVSGSVVWGGVIPMAAIGLARAYGVDLTPYLSSYGRSVFSNLQNASLIEALPSYPGLTWQPLVKPQYHNLDSIPPLVTIANEVDLGLAPSPTIPGLVGQGDDGILDGTFSDLPGIGTGDGVMVAGDVRALMRQYCASGDAITYNQYNLLDHALTVVPWAVTAITWLAGRFAGQAAPSNCNQIAPGNSLAPQKLAG
jgi:hypothetical protein